jgi:quercetin dioxygenase-like cupin family protein
VNFTLHEHSGGVETADGNRVVYDLDRNEAWFGAAIVAGPALVWEVEGERRGAVLAVDVELDLRQEWIARCDRVDFPPGAVAYRHVHPGPGIRCLVAGSLRIEDAGRTTTYGPLDAWFEGAEHPVVATASESADTAFVRVLLLPGEWRGRRTIRYLDPADEERPSRQRATVLLEETISL